MLVGILLFLLFQFAPDAHIAAVPTIVQFKVDTPSVNYADVEASTASANFSWQVIGLNEAYHLEIQVWIGEEWSVISGALQASETQPFHVIHPQNFGLPTYRLAVIDSADQVRAASYLQFDYNPIAADTLPQILSFKTDVTAVNANDLARGEVRIPVTWEVIGRQAHDNLIFEQILGDGSARVVELPRDFLWIPAKGEGMLAPIVSGTSSVDLRLSVVDLESGEVLTTNLISIPIFTPTPIPQQAVQPTQAATPPDNQATPQVENPLAPSTSENYFVSDATAEEVPGWYIVPPGDWATIRWSISGVESVTITGGDDFSQQGPLPATGSLSVCPRSGGTTYTLTAGSVSLSLNIYVPASTEYPAYSDPNYPACWK